MMTRSAIEYIKTYRAKGVRAESIAMSLRASGWRDADIAQAMESASSGVIPPGALVADISQSSARIITETDYPIQSVWILKQVVGLISAVFVSVILLFFGYIVYYLILLIAYTPIQMVVTALRRKNFHYRLDEGTLTVVQGVLSKQQRTIYYGTIQSVFASQDLFDRLFGLSSLVIENAAQGAGKDAASMTTRPAVDAVGFSKNKIFIPGLNSEDAEALKTMILNKISTHPVSDSQSGL